MYIAEFVPQVARCLARLRRSSRADPSRRSREHREVRCLGLVPSGQEPVDRENATVRMSPPSRSNHFRRATVPRSSTTVSSARTTVVPISDHLPAVSVCVVDPVRSGARTRGKAPDKGVRIPRAMQLPCGAGSGPPRCPRATSRVRISGVNGRPALGISAEPGSVE